MQIKLSTIGGVLLFLLLIIVPNFLSPYYQDISIKTLIFGLYTLGFNIIFGFTGLLNFGMSVFFGLGGYLALWSVVYLHASLTVSLAITIVISAIFSFVYALLIRRFKSHYFVAFTIVISMIFFYMAMAVRSITGANAGLTFEVQDLYLGFTSLNLYEPINEYYFVLVICVIIFFLIRKFFRTPYGKAIIAVRENEDRARMIGYNTNNLKAVSFTLSGVVSSLAGALYILYMGFDSANSFFWTWSAKAIWWGIIGGVDSLLGAFVGPGVLVFFEDLMSTWTPHLYLIIMGIIMILAIILAPHGFVGTIQNMSRKRKKQS